MVVRKKSVKRAVKGRRKPAKKASRTAEAAEPGSSNDGLRSPQELLDELHAEAARERRLRNLLSPIGSIARRPSRKRKTPSRK